MILSHLRKIEQTMGEALTGQTGRSARLVADAIVLSMTAGVLVLTLKNGLAKGTLAAIGRSSQETPG